MKVHHKQSLQSIRVCCIVEQSQVVSRTQMFNVRHWRLEAYALQRRGTTYYRVAVTWGWAKEYNIEPAIHRALVAHWLSPSISGNGPEDSYKTQSPFRILHNVISSTQPQARTFTLNFAWRFLESNDETHRALIVCSPSWIHCNSSRKYKEGTVRSIGDSLSRFPLGSLSQRRNEPWYH